MYVTRARKSLESGRFPTKILEQLEIDIDQTLPTLKLFTHGSPVRADLKEMICAWVVYRSDDGLGYVSIHLTRIGNDTDRSHPRHHI
jgi:hypothetical protein